MVEAVLGAYAPPVPRDLEAVLAVDAEARARADAMLVAA